MSDQTDQSKQVEQVWYTYLTTGSPPPSANVVWFESPILRPLVRRLPKDPRCQLCYYPFSGVGGTLARALLGVERSRLNPKICNLCERFAREHQGGAEVEASFLFADVRGSTSLAERMSVHDFSRLIDRFYQEATSAIYDRNGMVEKLIGDEVTGFFVPGLAGKHHARQAVQAGQAILASTGHGSPQGPWVPVGVGVHFGTAYIGTVGMEGGGLDIAVLGDTVNTAARLASQASAGEVVISEAARAAAGLEGQGMEPRSLELKGKEEPVQAWVLHHLAA